MVALAARAHRGPAGVQGILPDNATTSPDNAQSLRPELQQPERNGRHVCTTKVCRLGLSVWWRVHPPRLRHGVMSEEMLLSRLMHPFNEQLLRHGRWSKFRVALTSSARRRPGSIVVRPSMFCGTLLRLRAHMALHDVTLASESCSSTA
jgi:hypothetical protein